MPIDEEGPRRHSIPPGCTLDLEQCRALEQRGLDPAVIERHYKLGEDARRALDDREGFNAVRISAIPLAFP